MDPTRWLEDHGSALYGYALVRVRDVATAEDLVQETLTAGLESRHRFQGLSAERTWLFGILKHRLLDWYRRQYRESPVPGADPGPDPFDEERFYDHSLGPREWDSPEHQLERKEIRQALDFCLEKLPGRMRVLFMMREMDGTPGPEICASQGLSATNLHTTLYRTRAALRRCLEGRVLHE